jgi:hypothetical protein
MMFAGKIRAQNVMISMEPQFPALPVDEGDV